MCSRFCLCLCLLCMCRNENENAVFMVPTSHDRASRRVILVIFLPSDVALAEIFVRGGLFNQQINLCCHVKVVMTGEVAT